MNSKSLFFAFFLVLITSVVISGCSGEPCDENARKEAWRKYDVVVKEATKEKNNPEYASEFSKEYSKAVDGAIALRIDELKKCYCPLERPTMSDEDIKASRAALRRAETKFLINVATSYTASRRAVEKDGTPTYLVNEPELAKYVEHPMYIALSHEAFDSLRTTVILPIDPTLPDSIEQPIRIKAYKHIPVKEVLSTFGPYALDDDYRAFYNYDGPDFLSHIEEFHDNKDNWSRCGLSSVGRKSVLSICKTHELDSADVMDALITARVFCD